MTAQDARNITDKVNAADPVKVRIVLELWYEGIKRAAEKGLSAVYASDLGNVRTPIPDNARQEALRQLSAAGFEITAGTSDTEVSW